MCYDNKNIKIESAGVDKYIDKIKEKIDPLIDIINVWDLPMVRVPLNHVVDPEYSVVADIFKESDSMETYLYNKIALKKNKKNCFICRRDSESSSIHYALRLELKRWAGDLSDRNI